MPTVTVDTLREVINRSQVLTAPEKQEWFRLVEFMNDKQLLDLYHILVPQGVTPSLDPSSPESVLSAAVEQKAPLEIQKGDSSSAPVPVSTDHQSIGAGAPLSSFLQRTRGGSPQAMTEVVGSTSVQATQMPSASPPRNDFDISPKNTEAKTESTEHLAIPETIIEENQQEQTEQHDQFPAISEPIVTNVSQQPTPLLSKSAMDSEPLVEEAPAMTTLNTLADVAMCNVGTLRTFGVDELCSRLLKITKRKGYFDTVFALEQSPLFSAYVHTGMKLIELHMAFEDFQAQHSGGGEYLTREEFEGFADMLTKLGST